MRLRRLFQSGRPAGVHVIRAGPVQRFSVRLVDQAIMDGWMALKGDVLTLHARPPVQYRIVQRPGLFCCHCRVPQEHSRAAQQHVALWHGGKPSPDLTNVSGYARINYYEGRRMN